jgi:hypothetical protein
VSDAKPVHSLYGGSWVLYDRVSFGANMDTTANVDALKPTEIHSSSTQRSPADLSVPS